MKSNKNIVVLKEDAKVGGMLFEAGDAFVRTGGRWVLVEAEDEGSAEDKKEDEKEDKVEEAEGDDKKDDESDDDKMAALRAKKDESKKK